MRGWDWLQKYGIRHFRMIRNLRVDSFSHSRSKFVIMIVNEESDTLGLLISYG